MSHELSKLQLLQVIGTWPPAVRYVVAFSGGIDSSVLLHLLCEAQRDLPGRLLAAHVNHGISPRGGEWAEHCAEICSRLRVPLVQLRIDARPAGGSSPEERARELRYEILGQQLGPDEMLLTAHHGDDQAETLLLQLCRGAGPAGLAAMPALRRFGLGWHGRPLLSFLRSQVEQYAHDHALTWIDDDSNLDRRFDRNFLRQEIMPRLRSRWPSVATTLSRAARHQAAAAQLLREIARSDLELAREAGSGTLRVDVLASLDTERRENLLRYWITSRKLPLPDSDQLSRIWSEVICARADATPCVTWPGAEIRRHRGWLYGLSSSPDHDPESRSIWHMDEPMVTTLGELRAVRTQGRGIRASSCDTGVVEVRFRAGGEKLRMPGASHRRTLKALFQEAGVPPWLRDRIPLVYVDGRIAAVAGYWLDADFAAGPGEAGWDISWSEAG